MNDHFLHPGFVLRRSAPPQIEKTFGGVQIADARLAGVFGREMTLLVLHEGAIHAEGPAWQSSHGRLLFSDVPNRRLNAWYEADGRVEVAIDATWFINGNAITGDGSVWHCEHGRRSITRSAPSLRGGQEPVVTHYGKKRLNSPNDLTIASDGAIWFTDPIFGIVMPSQGALADPELDHRSVFRFDPVTREVRRMADFAQPNGIGFAPDGRTLYVSDTSVSLGEVPGMTSGDERSIYAFDVGADGALTNRRRFATPDKGYPDGFAIDRRGWLWSSAADGVHVYDADGVELGFVAIPCVVSNLCFGGADGRRLFIAASAKLFAIDLAT